MREEYDFLLEKYNELKEENKELREKLEFLEQGQPHPCTFDGKRNTSKYKRGERMREEYDFLLEKYNELKEENKELRAKLEFIEQGLPHPCTFDGKRNTSKYRLRNWLAKLKEEVKEVESEVDKLGDLSTTDLAEMNNLGKEIELDPLTEELLDVITVSTSILDWVGLSVWGRCRKQKDVNEKNKRRGYWK